MTLEELRTKIDAVDAAILPLFIERLRISESIGAYKKENGLPVRDVAREQEKLDELCKLVGAEDQQAIRRLFSALMEVSRQRQEGML